MNAKEKYFKEELQKIFPDKVVRNISSHKNLYGEIKKYLEEQDSDLIDFIESLDFIYRRGKHSITKEELLALLNDNFPNKIIPPINKLSENEPDIAAKIKKISKDNNLTVISFLQSQGFEVTQSLKNTSSMDKLAIYNLYQFYKGSFSAEFANLYGVTRQRISQIGKNKPKRVNNIWGNSFDEVEIEDILATIDLNTFTYKDRDTLIRIYPHKTQKNFAILYLNKDVTKCVFDLPPIILDGLIERRYHELSKQDFDLINALEVRGYKRGSVINTANEEDIELRKIIDRGLYASDLNSISKYLEHLGWKYQSQHNKLSDEELKQRILPYIDREGYFKMKPEDPNYASLKSFFSKRGFHSTEEWVNYFGFKYKLERRMNTTDKYKKLLENFVVYDNKVYIHTIHNRMFYTLLVFYGKRNNLSINNVISSLGYERIYTNDLPKGFVPFQLNIKSENISNEDYVDELNERITNEHNNEIFLFSEDPIYKKVKDDAENNQLSVENYLKQLGYSLIPPNEFINSFNSNVEDKLKNLNKLQNSLEITSSTQTKIKRSTELVRTLKNMYEHKCQVSDHQNEDCNIPKIIKSDGTPYVEVHHIINLSDSDLYNYNSILDSFKNIICVCPHHHRMLHYHEGGFGHLLADEERILFFETEKTRLYVNYNFHLSPTNIVMQKNKN